MEREAASGPHKALFHHFIFFPFDSRPPRSARLAWIGARSKCKLLALLCAPPPPPPPRSLALSSAAGPAARTLRPGERAKGALVAPCQRRRRRRRRRAGARRAPHNWRISRAESGEQLAVSRARALGRPLFIFGPWRPLGPLMQMAPPRRPGAPRCMQMRRAGPSSSAHFRRDSGASPAT